MYASSFTRPFRRYAVNHHQPWRMNSPFSPCVARAQICSSAVKRQQTLLLSEARRTGRRESSSSGLNGRLFYSMAGVAGLGLGMTMLNRPVAHCDTLPTSRSGSPPPQAPLPPPPKSDVNVYELSFGTVCGICAGVFVKKGVKALAFVFGGVFVLLQYLGSQSVVKVDWSAMGSRFENLFYTKDPLTGAKKAPNVGSLWRWSVDFLTADFQQRASFVAGFVLGIRIG